jgi:hypothetical protein
LEAGAAADPLAPPTLAAKTTQATKTTEFVPPDRLPLDPAYRRTAVAANKKKRLTPGLESHVT